MSLKEAALEYTGYGISQFVVGERKLPTGKGNESQFNIVPPNGTFDKTVSNSTLSQASGIFNVDIDNLGYQGAMECIAFLSTVKQCLFAFLSPSADGVKAGIRIGIVKNDFEYKQYFNPVQALLGKYQNDTVG